MADLNINQFKKYMISEMENKYLMRLKGMTLEIIEEKDYGFTVTLFGKKGEPLRIKRFDYGKESKTISKNWQKVLKAATDLYMLWKEKGDNITQASRLKANQAGQKNLNQRPEPSGGEKELTEQEETEEVEEVKEDIPDNTDAEDEYTLVLVSWIDSKGVISEWEYKDEIEPIQPTVCHSMGFVINDNDKYLEIAMTISEEMVLGRMCIPKACITRTKGIQLT